MSSFKPDDSARAFGPWYIRKRAIGLLLIVTLAALAVLFLVSSSQLTDVLEDSMSDELEESARLIDSEVERESRKMAGKLELLLGNHDLMTTFAERDRKKLSAQAIRVMASLREQGFTHFYFIEPDLKVFYRAHQPERHSDILKRNTARMARESMRVSSGMDIGPLGTLTLRVVAPVWVDGRHAGFVEIGKEVPTIIHDVQQHIGFQALLAISKASLNQATWQEGQVFYGYHYPWQGLADYVVMDFDHEIRLSDYAGIVEKALGGAGTHWQRVGERYVSAAVQPLMDAGHDTGVKVVVLRDVSDLVDGYDHLLWQAVLALVLVLMGGFVVIWVALARADRRLHAYHAEMERVVAERTAELSASNHELESFAYAVSHDLRAPLRSMDGFSEALLQDYGASLDEQGKHFLERIRAGAQRMAEMIDALLRLSRVTRREMAFQPVRLSEICSKALENLQEREPERSVDVVIQPDVEVMGDWMLLSIALENLLANAWKFTRQRHPARIEFGAEKRQGEFVCWVRDNGAGFDPAYSDKLFGAFQRLHTQDEFEGIGIGLATVQRIISRHAGRVWADGTPDQGATFFLAFPDAVGDS